MYTMQLVRDFDDIFIYVCSMHGITIHDEKYHNRNHCKIASWVQIISQDGYKKDQQKSNLTSLILYFKKSKHCTCVNRANTWML